MKMMLFYQKKPLINLFKENEQPKKELPKVFVAVAHITSVEESNNPEKGAAKLSGRQVAYNADRIRLIALMPC
ncbi:hypothetical protein IQ270_06455 [Microcoleus sp. LEGE 07076]|uniref:hypothetical protein n=1 Tax=Microcoleus sp. LEGE 07076 TaxID=915322 RepID=UPI001881B7F4|nr:hypothetical protein [Microcoleus sp. LEGE 07076]MBE9184370.1 hypothetical protein [Microcoleus sp. LEGE 07076]